MSDDALREDLRKSLQQFATRPVEEKLAQRVVGCATYVRGDVDDPVSYDRLRQALQRIEAERGTKGNRLFYMATPPSAFRPIACQLGRSRLACEENGSWRRIIIEKPFGTDLASARKLNTDFLDVFDENQLYRIQIHGVDAAGNVIVRRQLKRRYVLPFFQKLPACLIGMEACASSHHWSRELTALGHTVRLMPAAYVKPYVKRQKNDAADAEAICEAVSRANMRFVPTKTVEQQSCLLLHRTRHLFIRQQTAVINAIRAHLAEFGIVAPVGRNGVEQLLDVVADTSDKRLPEIARACVLALGAQLRTLKVQILNFDRQIMA